MLNGDMNRPSLMLTKPVTDYAPGSESQLRQRGAVSLQKLCVVVGGKKTFQM